MTDRRALTLREAAERVIAEWRCGPVGYVDDAHEERLRRTVEGLAAALGGRVHSSNRAALAPALDVGLLARALYAVSTHEGPTRDVGFTEFARVIAAEYAALASPADRCTSPDGEHYWTDAADDETGWHCTICGLTEYPGDPAPDPGEGDGG